mmetsp:Transcript_49705/g.127844  ORF Transcript_49705/g.127844 Transcript_49705/m.127844 type:complete len:346 (-) Transcript_49705:123-1160(-)|eukprot:CAMPEP_0113880410 /NCGR_PEP_ID=MMETSP0780_2-20120614/7770_1 /TAXON_ID=652834 /ORGANISM="Palpitomonas bilix" /LENGTH=345 /DNA_ID=CAMNT_0000867083 /DNA_START=77 /DNA_END=1114 /DNA_ORIENTATION=+ /assembly_acc=CAM_ASM_000599
MSSLILPISRHLRSITRVSSTSSRLYVSKAKEIACLLENRDAGALKDIPARRSFFYVPAAVDKLLKKAPSLHADTIVLDIEDGVAPSAKAAARAKAAAFLKEMEGKERASEFFVRINAVGRGDDFEKDMLALEKSFPSLPDGLVVPKVEDESQIRFLQDWTNSVLNKSLPIICGVETPWGLENITAIAGCSTAYSSPVEGIYVGGEDYSAAAGLRRRPALGEKQTHQLAYARSRVSHACSLFGITAIDIVSVQFKPEFEQEVREECAEGRDMAFGGKQCIHPNQIKWVHDEFSPTLEEVEEAKEIVDAYEAFAKEGVGAFTVRGAMVDLPVVTRARTVLKMAKST